MWAGGLRRFGTRTMIAGLALALWGAATAYGDDTGILGRLFGFGNNSSATNAARPRGERSSAIPYRARPVQPDNGGAAAAATGSAPAFSNFGGPPATPSVGTGPGPRISPRSRVSSAVTSADPLLTRAALGRSNDGSRFAMFLQVFSDGTVIDSEGVHHLRPAQLRPLVDAVQSGDLSRLQGHCGAPSTDFVEYVHVVVYERRFGRLNAHAFSYSGNPQGCGHAIHNLHTVIEKIQAQLARPASAPASAAPAPLSVAPGAGPASAAPTPPAPSPGPNAPSTGTENAPAGTGDAPAGTVIPLTPINPGR